MRLPEKGEDKDAIMAEIAERLKETTADYRTGLPTAKPGTVLDPVALEALAIVMGYNPNGIDGEMFKGSYELERDAIALTSGFFHKFRDPDAGVLLSGGTESFNQAMWILRNKYFADSGIDVRHQGLPAAVDDLRAQGVNKLAIISPVNYHFTNCKAADIFGLGTNAIEWYGLDEHYDPDFESLEEALMRVYDDGGDVVANLISAGDTTHGKVHDPHAINRVVREVAARYGRKAPLSIVDAAGTYLFLGMMQDNPAYDGSLPEINLNDSQIAAFIGDPHKQQMPYSCGMLILENWELLRHTDIKEFSNYIDAQNGAKEICDGPVSAKERVDFQALSTIPTSRSGYNGAVVSAYYRVHGKEGLRAKKEAVWENVKRLRDHIADSKHFDLVCEPQTQVVAFCYRGSGHENLALYERIKHSDDGFLISYDDGMMARNVAQMRRTQLPGYDHKYTGLFATIMEHNTPQGIDQLAERLEKEVRECAA